MNVAYTKQRFQDWFTQQWVIWRGQKINVKDYSWLIGPFGNIGGIGEDSINQLAKLENLTIERNFRNNGLIPSFEELKLSVSDLNKLAKSIIHFYEQTSNYNLGLKVSWNPFFKFFGIMVNQLFSSRINQLNVPISNINQEEELKSEIITLRSKHTNKIERTIWLRTIKSSGQVVYSGVYGTCKMPSGETCVKAVFPLPNGNATVIMSPSVGTTGELILDASGKKFGDAGFYFLMRDSKKNIWSRYIRVFRDKLVVKDHNGLLSAEQILTLWNKKAIQFNYKIDQKTKIS
ncbi:MAG: hypothetical protein DI598_04665 [Pseudopedobacter saltans]|uniref:Uncharacterized protein n=1 Tax=Pseudopedobacter saltans TaxID=151895 RepID=A0A2W5F412_9SPHI|nr:MAG: hypothetical protein DI598_04665 [Pseudopedobacter saltans]